MMNKILKWFIISLLATVFSFGLYSMIYASDWADKANTRVDNSEKTTLRLSDDIWVMADRIGVMADRILAMADKILETQRIQGKNVELTQKNILESMKLMNKTLEQNNKLIEEMIKMNSKLMDCMCNK